MAAALFYPRNKGVEASQPEYAGFPMKCAHLFFLSGIATYTVFGMAVAALLFVALAVGVVAALISSIKARALTAADCMLACVLFLLAAFFALPDGLGDIFNLEERIMLPMLLALAGWLALRLPPRLSGRAAAIIGLVFVALQTGDRMTGFAQIERNFAEYAEAVPQIPDHSAVIALDLDNIAVSPLPRSLKHPFAAVTRFRPELHFMGTALGEREIAFASNYEATASRPYFPLKYRPWLSDIMGDGAEIAAIASKGSSTKMATALKTGAAPVFYLALLVHDTASLDNPKVQALMKAVDADYDKVFASSQGHMTLYRMR